jgi:DNA-binding response OmpR family regulator
MVTALCGMNDIAAASALGVADYVTKPVDFTNLLEKISNILENRMSRSARK